MNFVLHGDNTVLSRNELNLLIKNNSAKELLRLNGKKIDLNQLIEACEAGSLFGQERLVVIEELHSHPSKKTLSDLINYLSALGTEQLALVMWESKPLTPVQLKKLACFTPKLYKATSLTFNFVDSLDISQFKFACEKDTPEFVFYMLARQIRLLLQLPSLKLPPWQLGKLKSQSARFTPNQLITLHDQLTDLDWRLKSGQTALNLQGETELILLNI
jgi:DNA polymerase III delta subunit